MSDKKYRAREAELKAQRKYNEKFYNTKERRYEKRAFFRFWLIFFDHIYNFLGINMFYSLIGIPMVLMGYMVMQLVYSAEQAGNGVFILPCIAIMLLLGIVMGGVNAASAYIMRCHIEEKHVNFFSDFAAAFKANFKQSIPFGIADSVLVLLLFSVMPLVLRVAGHTKTVYTILICLLFLAIFIYYSMRRFAYLQIVTINLKLPQIVRNSLFFVFLGLKGNLLNALISVAAIVAAVALIVFVDAAWVMMAVLFITLLLGIALVGFLQIFSAYGPFYKHLVEPELKPEPSLEEPGQEVSEEEAKASEEQESREDPAPENGESGKNE